MMTPLKKKFPRIQIKKKRRLNKMLNMRIMMKIKKNNNLNQQLKIMKTQKKTRTKMR